MFKSCFSTQSLPTRLVVSSLNTMFAVVNIGWTIPLIIKHSPTTGEARIWHSCQAFLSQYLPCWAQTWLQSPSRPSVPRKDNPSITERRQETKPIGNSYSKQYILKSYMVRTLLCRCTTIYCTSPPWSAIQMVSISPLTTNDACVRNYGGRLSPGKEKTKSKSVHNLTEFDISRQKGTNGVWSPCFPSCPLQNTVIIYIKAPIRDGKCNF